MPHINLKNKNSSQSLTAELTGSNNLILEIGTSTGYLTKILRELGNRIIGVEIDEEAAEIAEEYCDLMIIGDIEEIDLDEYLGPSSIDVVIFGDVLEHLKNPSEVLEKIKKYIKHDGSIVVSIPNVCHGDVLLNLLKGDFRYTPVGLLDQTHLRFFGFKNVVDLLNDGGFLITEIHTTRIPVGSTELGRYLGDIHQELLRFIRNLPNSDVYQFVLRAKPSKNQKNDPIPEPDLNEIFDNSIRDLLKENKQAMERKIAEICAKYQEASERIRSLSEELSERDGRIDEIKELLERSESRAQKLENEMDKIKKISKMPQLREKIDIPLFETRLRSSRSLIPLSLEEGLSGELMFPAGEMREIRIFTATHRRLNSDLTLSLKRYVDGPIIREAKAKGFAIKDNDFTRFSFEPIKDSSGTTFFFDLKSDGEPHAAVWYDPDSQPSSLKLKRDGKLIGGEIGLQAFSSQEINDRYHLWRLQREPSENELENLKEGATSLGYRPKISLITPVCNDNQTMLKAAIESVTNQIYDNWELCISVGDFEKSTFREVLEEYARRDPRIQIRFISEDQSVAESSNEALSMATGEFVAFLDGEDELSPIALYEVVGLLNQNPDLDFIYSDEDKIDEDGARWEPFFKPDWSPDTFLSCNYLSHLSAIRKSVVDEVGGFRSGYDGAEEYDLFLRVAERIGEGHIGHIPKILYHLRIRHQSEALARERISSANAAAIRALNDAVIRRGTGIEGVSDGFMRGWDYRIIYEIRDNPLVSIIIPTRDKADILRKCVESIINKTEYDNYNITIVDNGSESQETLDYYEELKKVQRIKLFEYKYRFNYSAINNFAVSKIDAEYIIFLDNDTEIIDSKWISRMLEHAQREEVGAVGAKLLYPDGTIQHAGVILGIGGVAGHSHKHFPAYHPGYFSRIQMVQNLSAVTAACMMTKRSLFEEVGGFDEKNLAVAFNDVDYCLKLRRKGYLVLYTPYAEVYHHESMSRGYEDTPKKLERFLGEFSYMREKWGDQLDNDPYYNENLTRDREDFSIRTESDGELLRTRGEIKILSDAVSERDDKIIELDGELLRTRGEIKILSDAVSERDDKIIELDGDLQRARGEIKILSDAVSKRDDKIIELDGELLRTRGEIKILSDAVSEREGRIAAMAEQLRQSESEAQRLEREIFDMRRSIIWQLLMKYHGGLVERCMPPGTGRRSCYNQAIEGGRILTNEGFRSFSFRARKKLSTKVPLLKEDLSAPLFETKQLGGPGSIPISLDEGLSGEFSFPAPGMNEIRIFTATYRRKNGDLALCLRSSRDGPVLRTAKVKGHAIRDNGYTSFRFKPVKEIPGGKIFFELQSVGEPSAAVWYDPSGSSGGLKLCRSGEVIGGSIGLQAFSSLEIRDRYHLWRLKNEPSKRELDELKSEAVSLKYRPKISIITPVWNTDERWLRLAIESALGQIYDNWELCIADGNSQKPHVKTVLEEYKKKDKRIKVRFLSENEGIAGNSNEALSMASGEFVAFLDHDDELAPFALYEVVRRLNEDPFLDYVYSDEDKIDEKGERRDPFFKPDWSPDMFLSCNYLCHLSVIRKKIVDEVGGFRSGYDGSQDYDLFLRVTEKIGDGGIGHIPKILYHWRMIPESAATSCLAKPYAYIAAKKALKDAMVRSGVKIDDVLDGFWTGSYRIKYKIEVEPRVSIIIPTKDNVKMLRKCVDSIIQKTLYRNYDIVLIDNQSVKDETFEYYRTIDNDLIKILNFNEPFNYAKMNNLAVSLCKSEYILFLNNDIEVISEEWLNAMVECAQKNNTGAVGAKLVFPNHLIQHCGVILNYNTAAIHHYYKYPNHHGYFGTINMIRNFSAVTAACMMTKKSLFEEVGGFDEKNLAVAFNDVDYCLKLRRKEYLIVYTPYAELYHHESLSRGYDDTPEKRVRFQREVAYMREKWGEVLDNDPYYNPNLTRDREDFSIRV